MFLKKYTNLELKSLEWKFPVMNQTFLKTIVVVVRWRIFMLLIGEFYRESRPGGRLGQARPGHVRRSPRLQSRAEQGTGRSL